MGGVPLSYLRAQRPVGRRPRAGPFFGRKPEESCQGGEGSLRLDPLLSGLRSESFLYSRLACGPCLTPVTAAHRLGGLGGRNFGTLRWAPKIGMHPDPRQQKAGTLG